MKAINILGALLCMGAVMTSCEKVINIDLDDSKTRLVVEGGIFHHVDATDNTGYQEIKLSTNFPYFGNQNVPHHLSGAEVNVKDNQTGTVVAFTESITTPGLYTTDNLIAEVNHSYTLNITAVVGEEEQVFEATDSITRIAPPLESVSFEYEEDEFEDEEEEKEVGYITLVSFTEPQETIDYYKFTTIVEGEIVNAEDIDGGTQYTVIKRDEYLDEDVDSVSVNEYVIPEGSSKEVEVRMTVITKPTYYYLFTLYENAANAGSDFPASEVKSNIINRTEPNLYGLGYFHCGSVSKATGNTPE
jgi:hypothetical protein